MQTTAAGGMSNGVRLKVQRDISIHSVSETVRKGDEKACSDLIRRGIDLNQRYGTYLWTVLLEAAMMNRPKIIAILVKGGAKLDLPDVDRRTPLMWAAKNGHSEAVEILLRKGANPSLKDEMGCTAILYAKDKSIRAMIRAKIVELRRKPKR